MNNRIKELRKQLGLTQQEFADRLKLKRNTIATYEMGKATPSNRTISDICEAYNVNREWLETGAGNMFLKLDKKSELSAFVSKALNGESKDYSDRLVSALLKLNEKDWELLASIAETLVSQKEKEVPKFPSNPDEFEKAFPPLNSDNENDNTKIG